MPPGGVRVAGDRNGDRPDPFRHPVLIQRARLRQRGVRPHARHRQGRALPLLLRHPLLHHHPHRRRRHTPHQAHGSAMCEWIVTALEETLLLFYKKVQTNANLF